MTSRTLRCAWECVPRVDASTWSRASGRAGMEWIRTNLCQKNSNRFLSFGNAADFTRSIGSRNTVCRHQLTSSATVKMSLYRVGQKNLHVLKFPAKVLPRKRSQPPNAYLPFSKRLTTNLATMYTEAKVDVTQEIEQRAQQAAQAGADHCALCSISSVTSTLASVYTVNKFHNQLFVTLGSKWIWILSI